MYTCDVCGNPRSAWLNTDVMHDTSLDLCDGVSHLLENAPINTNDLVYRKFVHVLCSDNCNLPDRDRRGCDRQVRLTVSLLGPFVTSFLRMFCMYNPSKKYLKINIDEYPLLVYFENKSELETCRRENGNKISGKDVREKACIYLETCLPYPIRNYNSFIPDVTENMRWLKHTKCGFHMKVISNFLTFLKAFEISIPEKWARYWFLALHKMLEDKKLYKNAPVLECKPENRSARGPGGRPAPLLRSRTLPAIVAPGLNILQAQIDARYNEMRLPSETASHHLIIVIFRSHSAVTTGISVVPSSNTDNTTCAKRGSTASQCTKLLTPRISFTDDTIGKKYWSSNCLTLKKLDCIARLLCSVNNVAKLVCSIVVGSGFYSSVLTVGQPGIVDCAPRPPFNFSCRFSSVTARRVSDSGPASRESSKEHSARSGRLSTSSIGGSQPLNRLARLLNQRPSFTPSDEIPRRLSWESIIPPHNRALASVGFYHRFFVRIDKRSVKQFPS
ncbi:hypothetical protein EAG_04227 [Camponotus floridanus]|uniref:Uncharacterized protein n=1 Tax=Camponotus floridanus TaxID=104421 RepID=E2AWX3_CAMFO|nr:hypothetical protein EAG_04227 [Camponotus floridanus]